MVDPNNFKIQRRPKPDPDLSDLTGGAKDSDFIPILIPVYAILIYILVIYVLV